MKIYDISQTIPECEVYPGDPSPEIKKLSSIENGDLYNLTAFSMCAHNGTHVDAPFHFINSGAAVEKIPLYKTVGFAFVVKCDECVSAVEAEKIINTARKLMPEAAKRILIKGKAVVTEEGAEVFAKLGVELLGSETQSVGPQNAPMAVHKILLRQEIVLLEGIRLSEISDGVYFLCAAPISISGADGAPCRSILIEF